MTYDVLVEVTLRPGISDPQGQTVERALPALGYDDVRGVHIGKAIRFTIEAADETTAEARVADLCDRFLTNPVIEQARIEVTEAAMSK